MILPMIEHRLYSKRFLPALITCIAGVFLAGTALTPNLGLAQRPPGQEEVRRNVDPDLLVSAPADLAFDEFIRTISPIYFDQTGKRVVDPQGRTSEIGVSIQGAYYTDALESVLQANGLRVEETENVFLIRKGTEGPTPVENSSSEGGEGEGSEDELDPTAREVRINAVFFNLNLTKVRSRGLQWNQILGQPGGRGGGGSGSGGAGGGGASGGGSSGGSGGGGSAGGGSTGGGSGGGGQGRFALNTSNLFESVDGVLDAPDRVGLGQFRAFLNAIERNNAGRTIANPQITVREGNQGSIQIGQDVPIQTTDFAGNTVTEFVSTGVIINVEPEFLRRPAADTAGAPMVEFINLDVQVENSSSQPSSSGTIINRNQAETEVFLLDGEATAIGGLVSTQKSATRSGVPVLKDLPGWVFGLRYIFGSTDINVSKRELIILLEAEAVPSVRARSKTPEDKELLKKRREKSREVIRSLGEDLPDPTNTDTTRSVEIQQQTEEKNN